MPVIQLEKTTEYKGAMKSIVEQFRPWLEEMGYNPDEQWDLCEWLVWHKLNDKD